MLGFVVGTACLLGLIHLLRRGRGCGGWHGHGGPWRRRGRGGFGPRFMLRRIFERLDTSPSQEKVIVDAVEELWSAVSDVRREGEAVRAEVGRAVRQPVVDETSWEAARAKLDGAADTVAGALGTALGKIHAVLDDKQRVRLAELIETGPRWADPWCGHPYRCAS